MPIVLVLRLCPATADQHSTVRVSKIQAARIDSKRGRPRAAPRARPETDLGVPFEHCDGHDVGCVDCADDESNRADTEEQVAERRSGGLEPPTRLVASAPCQIKVLDGKIISDNGKRKWILVETPPTAGTA